MSVYEEKNNPPIWFIIIGAIVVAIVAVFVMLAPTKQYTQKNQYYLKGAQSSLIINTDINMHTAYISGVKGGEEA